MDAVVQRFPRRPRLLVIGVGNLYRGDDAVGLRIARRLQSEIGDEVLVREEAGEGAALMEAWHGADVVILVDAVCSGQAPGTIYRFEAHKQALPAALFRHSTHAFGVAEVVALAHVLQRLPPRLIVYGIEGKTFAVGDELSPAVEDAIEQVVTRVREEMASQLSTLGEPHA